MSAPENQEDQALTLSMHELLAQMARMQAELTALKERTGTLPQPVASAKPVVVSATRRSTLKRLGLALLGGIATTAALGETSAVQAKIIANPNTNSLANNAGMAVFLPGAAGLTGNNSGPVSVKVGLFASGDVTVFDVINLPTGNTGLFGAGQTNGVYGSSSNGVGVSGKGLTIGVGGQGTGSGSIGVSGGGVTTGVYGQGSSYGVNGQSTGDGGKGVYGQSSGPNSTAVYGFSSAASSIGVYGQGTTYGLSGVSDIGVHGSGGSTGVYGVGDTTGVSGFGSTGVTANSATSGLNSPALRATHTGTSGIGAIIGNNSLDTTILLSNGGTGPLFKAWGAGGIPKVEITNAGLIKANGGFQTGGADLAEFIPVTEKLEPGDVVEIDLDNPGQFRRCATPCSLNVAGVVSTLPGVCMGADQPATGENHGPQLALAGRIPVKVTDEGGPIRPGDLLVASSTPGFAMRAFMRPRMGSVLGKALGNLADGSGVVEMLVMLR